MLLRGGNCVKRHIYREIRDLFYQPFEIHRPHRPPIGVWSRVHIVYGVRYTVRDGELNRIDIVSECLVYHYGFAPNSLFDLGIKISGNDHIAPGNRVVWHWPHLPPAYAVRPDVMIEWYEFLQHHAISP